MGIAALDIRRQKGNVNRWSISSSKANTLPPSHCSLHLTLLLTSFSSDHVNHPDSHKREESRFFLHIPEIFLQDGVWPPSLLNTGHDTLHLHARHQGWY